MRFGRNPFARPDPRPEDVLSPDELVRLRRQREQYMLGGRLALSRLEACRWLFVRWLAEQGRIES